MPVAPVRVNNSDFSCFVDTYAVLDSASDTTLCTQAIRKLLSVEDIPVTTGIVLANCDSHSEQGQYISLNIQHYAPKSRKGRYSLWRMSQLSPK